MSVFILTWNPTKWSWEENGYDREIRQTARGRGVNGSWSIGNRKSGIVKGDRGFVLRGHDQRGIVASGTFTKEIYEGLHWDGSGRSMRFADLRFDAILGTDDRLPIEVLKRKLPGFPWDRVQGSGATVNSPSAERLLELWDDHLEQVGRGGGAARPWRSPDEDYSYEEGGKTKVNVNRYERDQRVRQACIDHWGYRCSVCSFDFEAVYGKLGKEFIHVHHLNPLASNGQARKVDPVKDLRPVCPNCHAMLHRGEPLLTIGGLRSRLRRTSGLRVGVSPSGRSSRRSRPGP